MLTDIFSGKLKIREHKQIPLQKAELRPYVMKDATAYLGGITLKGFSLAALGLWAASHQAPPEPFIAALPAIASVAGYVVGAASEAGSVGVEKRDGNIDTARNFSSKLKRALSFSLKI